MEILNICLKDWVHATERPTSKQITNVLNSIQQKFGDDVVYAIHMLFQLLDEGETADEIDMWYLLSECKQLVRSTELILKFIMLSALY